MTATSLIVRTNIDRKLGIVGLLTLLPVFNKSISVLVAPPLGPTLSSPDSDVNYLSIWTQVRRRRRGPRPQVTSAPVPVRSALVIITHITITGPRLFSRHHESLLSARSATVQQVSEYYYRCIETLKTLRHLAFLRSRDHSLCCSCGWSRPSDPNRHRLGSLVTLWDNKVDGKVLAVGILPLNISIKLTFRAKNSST